MGIVLKFNAEPRWFDLYDGAKVFAAAPQTSLVYVARASAARLIAELVASGEAVTKVGARIVDMPDLDTDDGLKATTESLFLLSLAELVITDWSGVFSDDKKTVPVPFAPEMLVHLLADPLAADGFMKSYLRPLNEVVDAGNV